MTQRNLHIAFGAMSPRLEEQLKEQGLRLDLEPVQRGNLQQDIDEVTRLRVRGVLTEAESDRARKRIFQVIKKWVKPL